MSTENSKQLYLERSFIDTRSGLPVAVRLTPPIHLPDRDTWVCELEITGLDEKHCVTIEQVSPFDAVVSAAETLHRITAPHEQYLRTESSVGYSGFPRVLSVLTSQETLKEIDLVLERAQPRKIKWLKRR